MDVIIASSCCPSILYRFQMITVLEPSLSSSTIIPPSYCFLLSCAFQPFCFCLSFFSLCGLSLLSKPCALSFIPSYPQHHLLLTITSPLPCAPPSPPYQSLFFPYYLFLFTTASHAFMVIIPARFLTVYDSVHISKGKKKRPMGGTCLPQNTLAVSSKKLWQMTGD